MNKSQLNQRVFEFTRKSLKDSSLSCTRIDVSEYFQGVAEFCVHFYDSKKIT